MRRSVWLALAASLLHGKAARSPSPLLLLRGIPGAFRRLRAPRAGARFGGSREEGRWVALPGVPGKGEPRSSGLLALGGGGHRQGAWGAPPLAFPEEPAGLSFP